MIPNSAPAWDGCIRPVTRILPVRVKVSNSKINLEKNLERITPRITFVVSNNKQKHRKMTTINNLSIENLMTIATEVGGKFWQKADKTRIYVSGGNNYHYDGKWFYEISADGTWESKVYLTSGYNNKNRENYVANYLAIMDQNMESALSEQSGDAPILDSHASEEIEATLLCEPVAIVENEHYNPKQTPIKYVASLSETNMINHYHGCGRGVAYVKDGKVIAFRYGTEPVANEPKCDKSYQINFSCTQICFNSL
jgi:hypothetical protein